MPWSDLDGKSAKVRVNWRQVGAFVGLTFGLTYLHNLYLWLTVGYKVSLALGTMLQGMMLIPAWSAFLLQTFFFKESPLYFRNPFIWPRVFAWFYLVWGLVYVGLGVMAASTTWSATASLVVQALAILGLVWTIVFQFLAPKDERRSAGLGFGSGKWYVLFGVLFVGIYAFMTVLNFLFGLGQAVDLKQMIAAAIVAQGQSASGLEQVPTGILLVSTAVQSVLGAPFLALLITFGEEYGWRGYLQPELMKVGRILGVVLLGIIWGLWHAPIIAMGHNYPGYPVAGIFLMMLYTIALAFLLGYALLKSGSVLLCAFLHGLNNQVYGFLTMAVYHPKDPVFSFGIGVYGLIVFAAVVVLLLTDPIWREHGMPKALS